MRHRQRIRKDNNLLLSILQTFNHHLLHSDKSTYFYNSNGKQQHKLTFSHSWQTIPLVCSSFALLGLGIGLINPSCNDSITNNAYALEDETAIDDSSILPTAGVALRIDTPLNNDGTITKLVENKGTNYLTVDFTVGANDVEEYSVFVQAESSRITGTALGDVIKSISADTLGNAIAAKEWGVNLTRSQDISDPTTLTYSAAQTDVNTPADNVKSENGLPITDLVQPYTLTFAANLTDASADHYTNNITLSVVAAAKQTTLLDLTYMQDMETNICKNSIVHNSKQLIDKRDNKKYWVTRLRDGNCWMTQNLDFNIPTTLTEETSDVEGTVSMGSTKVAKFANWGSAEMSYVAYYDLGNLYYHPYISSSSCYPGTDDTLTVCGIQSTGDEHYQVGNLYSYGAATAKTGISLSALGENASGSICPKGWQLPKSGRDTSNNTLAPWNDDKTFANLFESYGYDWDKVYYANSLGGGTAYEAISLPFYFTVVGRVYKSTYGGSLGLGADSSYFSSTAQSNEHAFTLRITYPSAVFPSSYEAGGNGYSIRCVAR